MMYELPLFPLNTVLFPGMPLTLHIFEERYKEMINNCVGVREPFGIVLIREGVEALGPLAEPHSIGCTAEIAQVQPLAGGRMNILVIGRQRFRILSLHQDHSYLTGVVENAPLDLTSGEEINELSSQLRPWVEEYLDLLSKAGDVEFDASQLPDDPETLGYLAATVLQVPNLQKQQLLTAADTFALLDDMRGLYRQELPILRLLLQDGERMPAGPGPFSLS